MRKFLLAAIVAVLLIAVFTVSAWAAGTPSATLTADVSEAHRGTVVTVTVSLSGTASVASIGVKPSYDAAALEWLEDGSRWLIDGKIAEFDFYKGNALYAADGHPDISGNVLTLAFKVKNGARAGASTIGATVKVSVYDEAAGTTSAAEEVNVTATTVTVLASHRMTETAEDAYLKAQASCTEPTTYWKSCSVCGEASTSEFFTSGSTLPHVYGNHVKDALIVSAADCTTAAQYKKSCNTCGVASATETFVSGVSLGHTGGAATCTERAVCTRCSQPYGGTLPHTYNREIQLAGYKKNDASCTEKLTYYKSCICGDKGTATFTVGATLPHTYTSEVAEERYLCAAATCEAAATYYRSCTCGEKGTETFTSGDPLGHSYTTAWQRSESGHWYECATCHAKKDEAAHVAGPEATETADQICTVCEFIITPSIAHTHSYGTEWSTGADEHWHACACGDKKDVAAHTFENDCDAACDVCGYTREITHAYETAWSSDENGHWYACEGCGAKKDEAAHTAGPEATEEAAQTCTVCGYVLAEQLTHQHAFGEEWQTDDTSHWHVCACGEQSALAPHTWNAGEVTAEPTTETEGRKAYTCTACGETKTEQLDKLPPETNGKDNTGMIVAIVAAAVVVAAGAAGAVVFVLKKRRM